VTRQLLHDKEFEQAGKLIVAADLLEKFEIFDITTKLVETHKTKTAMDLIFATPELGRKELASNIVKFFSNDDYYEFAQKLVYEFDLDFKDFPELKAIVNCRNWLVDLAFLPPSESKFVPLNVLEDLITGNQKMLLKLFNSLIRANKPQNARGVYNRHNFSKWAPKAVQNVAQKIKYDIKQDIKPKDFFGPISVVEGK